jgi:ADP-ribosylglycohydrolase|nr:ADP-ribosylglycohydrolase family protein [Candidatus Krumholzibacteria bacterium]
MIGAIAGDIAGSTFEFQPTSRLDIPFFAPQSRFTDDTVLTVATAFTLLTDGDYAANYRLFGRVYPLAGYGQSFRKWLGSDDPQPYNSWGNGSAMRVSPVGYFLDEEKDVLAEAARSAEVTHNHPEGVKGAQAVALGVFLARRGEDKDTIRQELGSRFGYDLARTTDDIRPGYRFDVSCQGSVPEAIICFLEAGTWQEAVSLAISLGGDADTQACIAGALAEAALGPVDQTIEEQVRTMLPEHLLQVVDEFHEKVMA